MKKGLYLNSAKKATAPLLVNEDAIAKSFNILSAYDQIVPSIGLKLQKKRKSVGSTKRSSKARRTINYESNDSGSYMNVIRDSHAIISKREQLERQKREILNMDFNISKRDTTSDLNKFLSERVSSAS